MTLQRRQFMSLIGAAVGTWPFAGLGQAQAMPLIGILSSASRAARMPDAFRDGLRDGGFIEGRNVDIEYRFAEGQYDRLPGLVTELLNRRVRLLVAIGGTVSAHAAKAATTTIPILFVTGSDPVRLGLVSNLSRPAGNATGVSVYTNELTAKRLELLRQLVPNAKKIGMLANPTGVATDLEIADMETAIRASGQEMFLLKADSADDFEPVFVAAVEQKADALFVTADPFFTRNRTALVRLAARHSLPVAYPWSAYTEVGGLMSYGPSLTWAYHEIGLYAGRIINGANPGDLPVQLPTKFDLAINLKAARALGLTISRTLLAGADKLLDE
jgi:ABC-type uncharacterized transport system substrate-binding protein